MSKKYLINEIYFTIQGEGIRYGLPHVFVRFSKCNLTCGFCDTEFESYREMTAEEVLEEAMRLTAEPPPRTDGTLKGQRRGGSPLPFAPCRNVMFCGGEPLMQLDEEMLSTFKAAAWFTVCETNGTLPAPEGLDWIACSPKVAEHAIRLERCNELKYVRGHGQGIPHPRIPADHYLISPMFEGNQADARAITWCAELVKAYPQWRLTIQHHKASFGDMR